MKVTCTTLLALTFIISSLGSAAKADDTKDAPEGAKKEKEAKKDAAPEVEGVKVTVTGRVTNLKPARPYLSKESYLQLLAVPAGGNIRTDLRVANGSLVATYKSDLAKSSISPAGAFRLQAKLKPGSYFVVVQSTKSGGPDDAFRALVKGRDDAKWKIEISSDSKRPLVIDGGDVELP